MNDENYKLILNLIQEHPIILYIVGVFLSLASGLYLMSALKAILPQKKEDPKKGEQNPATIIINPSDDLIEKYEQLAEGWREFSVTQRDFYKTVISDIIVEKQLDDTIPLRDEIFRQLDEVSKTNRGE